MQSQRGFTLIELLVVIAIIGMLSSVILASLNTARAKARDAKRRVDLKSIQTALELYYSTNNAYPVTGWVASEPVAQPGIGYLGTTWIPGLDSTYISKLPTDPKGGNSTIAGGCAQYYQSSYLYTSDGQNYAILSHCAPEGTWTSSDGMYDPLRPGHAWKLCNSALSCNSW